MCGRYALTTPADVLEELFKLVHAELLEPRYNIAPTQPASVIRRKEDGDHLELLTWGLVPWWADNPSVGGKMINARVESVDRRPAYREAFVQRRCVVPADGFFEWREIEGVKQPYFIHRADGLPMLFAGLWERWRDRDQPDAERLTTFVILTRDAVKSIAELHDRMPLVLGPEEAQRWLDRDLKDAEAVRKTIPREMPTLAFYPVSRRVNKVQNDDARLLEPVREPEEPEQPTLF